MIVIFTRAGLTVEIAINAFHVTKIVPMGKTCTIYFSSGTFEAVKGTLEEVTKKLNGFIPDA